MIKLHFAIFKFMETINVTEKKWGNQGVISMFALRVFPNGCKECSQKCICYFSLRTKSKIAPISFLNCRSSSHV